MLKLEWPLLLPANDPAYAAIKQLSEATFDLSEFIVDILLRFQVKHKDTKGTKKIKRQARPTTC